VPVALPHRGRDHGDREDDGRPDWLETRGIQKATGMHLRYLIIAFHAIASNNDTRALTLAAVICRKPSVIHQFHPDCFLVLVALLSYPA
jgi:hypothetical protein